MSLQQRKRLPRLPRPFYQGHAAVHWVQAIAGRSMGWLDGTYHFRFRELMIHTAARYRLVCPVYNLMPDHQHIIWMGSDPHSDQLNAMAFLRTHLEKAMAPVRFQRQAYDRLLRRREREKGALAGTCRYILENPVRKNLVATPEDWPYHGTIAPGYPLWDPLHERFWERFWTVYGHLLEQRRDS